MAFECQQPGLIKKKEVSFIVPFYECIYKYSLLYAGRVEAESHGQRTNGHMTYIL